MMKEEKGFDVIVLGLGWTGISTVYQLSRAGYSVLGIEKGPTISGIKETGYQRLFRRSQPDPKYEKMQNDSENIWLQIEKEAGVPLI